MALVPGVLSLKFAQQACRLLMVSVPEGPNVYSDARKSSLRRSEMYQDLEDRLHSSGVREAFRDSGYKYLAALRLRRDFVS
jgi:hypothetical protein